MFIVEFFHVVEKSWWVVMFSFFFVILIGVCQCLIFCYKVPAL